MEDRALQLYVDTEHVPILIRLSGILDQATAGNVVPVVRELIADGGRDFELQTPALSVRDARATDTLADVRRLVLRSGGRFTWAGATETGHDVARHPDDRWPRPVRCRVG
jgi:hypothetical protein